MIVFSLFLVNSVKSFLRVFVLLWPMAAASHNYTTKASHDGLVRVIQYYDVIRFA